MNTARRTAPVAVFLLLVNVAALISTRESPALQDQLDRSTASELVSITKQVIRAAAELGIDAAGSAVLDGSWPIFKKLFTPVFKALEGKFPRLFLLEKQPGSPEAHQVAEQAAAALSTDKELQQLLVKEFSALKEGQGQILAEIRRIEQLLFRSNENFRDFENKSDLQFKQIMESLEQLRRQSTRDFASSGPSGAMTKTLGKHGVRFARPAQLTNLQGIFPRWANRSESIVYVSRSHESKEGAELMLSRDRGRSAERLLSRDQFILYPQFSHDDRRIAFITSDRTLYVYNVFDRSIVRVANKVNVSSHSANHVSWSPTSARLIYSIVDTSTGADKTTVYVYDAERRESRAIWGRTGQDSVYTGIYPKWSPDGAQIGISIGLGGHHEFVRIDAAKRAAVIPDVTLSKDFEWLSNQQIVYVYGGAGTYRLAKYEIASSKLSYLTRYEYFAYPAISWDRSGLAYASGPSNVTEYLHMDMRTLQVRPLFQFTSTRLTNVFPSFDPNGSAILFEYGEEIFLVRVQE